MATGYIFTKTGNSSTKVVHVTNDVVDLGRTKIFKGPVLIEENDASLISIKEGGGNAMSLNISQIVTIDGSAPAGTMEGIIDQLDAVFPDASTTGGSGGGVSLPSMSGKANYDVQVNGAASNLLYRKKLYVDLRDFNGLDGTFNNDNTSIFQQAMDEAATFGSIDIVAPAGHFAIDGALQTTDGTNAVNNAQLFWPYRAQGTNPCRSRIIGSSKQKGAIAEYGFTAAGDSTGTIIESTILGTGHLFGNAYSDPSYGGFHYGDFSFAAADYENLTIRLRTKTGSTHISNGMGGINGRNISQMTAKHVLIDVQSTPQVAVAPVAGTIGIIFPQRNNNGDCRADDLIIRGFESAINVGEHFVGGQLVAVQCTVAIVTDVITGAVHPAIIQKLIAEGIGYVVWNRGGMNIKIEQASIERGANPGKYFDYVKDVQADSTGITALPDFEPTGSATAHNNFYTNDFSKVILKKINDVDIDESVQVLTAGVFTFNPLLGKNGSLTLTTNTTITLPDVNIRREFAIVVAQDATGGRTLEFASTVYQEGAIGAAANDVSICKFSNVGGTWIVVISALTSTAAGSGSYSHVFTDLSGWSTYFASGSDASIVSHNGGGKLHLKSTTESGLAYKTLFTAGSTISQIVVTVDDVISGTLVMFLGDIAGGTGSLISLNLSAGVNTFNNVATTGTTVGQIGLSASLNTSTEGYITSIAVTP